MKSGEERKCTATSQVKVVESLRMEEGGRRGRVASQEGNYVVRGELETWGSQQICA